MRVQKIQETDVDICVRCYAVYFDANELQAAGIDGASFFGFRAAPAGASTRQCPDHQQPMTEFSVQTPAGPMTLERAGCCGGVLFDAGEVAMLQQRPAPVDGGARACSRCDKPMRRVIRESVEFDQCYDCALIFYEHGEPERMGIDTGALFSTVEGSARRIGPSGQKCPDCQNQLTLFQGELFGRKAELFFDESCAGLMVNFDDREFVRRLSRIAVNNRADGQYARGEKVQPTTAERLPSEKLRSEMARQRHEAAVIASAVDSIQNMMHDRHYWGHDRHGDW